MTASLLFFQAQYHSQARDTERSMLASSVPNCLTVSKTNGASSCTNSDSFLKTFEKISNAHNSNGQPQAVGKEEYFPARTNNSDEKFADTADTLTSILIEKEGITEPDSELGSSPKLDEILSSIPGLADLKLLIDQLEQTHNGPYTKTELARLIQLMANNQADTAISSRVGLISPGFGDSRLKEFDGLNHEMDEIVSDQEIKSDSIAGQLTGGASSDESILPSRSIESIKTEIKGLKDSSVFVEKTGVSTQADHHNRIALATSSGNPSTSEFLQLNQPPTESSTDVKTASGGNKEMAFGQQQRSADDMVRDAFLNPEPRTRPKTTNDAHTARALTREQLATGENVRMDLMDSESQTGKKIITDTRTSRTSESAHRFGGESVPISGGNAEASLVSKMIHDAQMARENQMKMGDPMIDETVGKVTKVDAGSNDSGLPGSQHQLTEKTLELTSLSRQTNPDQDGLRTQTLDQIIRKAVVYMRNGQHEAKIELKPEFLGHVRMQVTTENHQVTVKILTEFGFVKEMVENNIHQLKADLQQQGLQVDKLEVTVSNDSDENKHSHGKSGQAKTRQHGGSNTNAGNEDKETPKRRQAGDAGQMNADELTVDYFV